MAISEDGHLEMGKDRKWEGNSKEPSVSEIVSKLSKSHKQEEDGHLPPKNQIWPLATSGHISLPFPSHFVTKDSASGVVIIWKHI